MSLVSKLNMFVSKLLEKQACLSTIGKLLLQNFPNAPHFICKHFIEVCEQKKHNDILL